MLEKGESEEEWTKRTVKEKADNSESSDVESASLTSDDPEADSNEDAAKGDA